MCSGPDLTAHGDLPCLRSTYVPVVHCPLPSWATLLRHRSRRLDLGSLPRPLVSNDRWCASICNRNLLTLSLMTVVCAFAARSLPFYSRSRRLDQYTLSVSVTVSFLIAIVCALSTGSCWTDRAHSHYWLFAVSQLCTSCVTRIGTCLLLRSLGSSLFLHSLSLWCLHSV